MTSILKILISDLKNNDFDNDFLSIVIDYYRFPSVVISFVNQ